MQRTLFIGNKNASSWAMRAWLALREQGLEFEEQLVDIRRPQRFVNLARIARFSPPGAVPVLVEDDAVICDSLAIMEYASEIGPRPLWPSDPRRRAQARGLTAWVHAGLSNICARLSFEASFYPHKRLMTPQELIESDRIFDVWERSLQANSGPYLFGDLSLADLSFVPVVLRIGSHREPGERFPLTQAWCQRLSARPAVQEWLAEAKALPPVTIDDYGCPPRE